MELTFASYNIHKAVGTDGRRDPHRILAVLREIDADVVALQECDRRFGARAGVIPREAIAAETPYDLVPLAPHGALAERPMTPESIGWHGNALLVRRGARVISTGGIALPAIEPRGAVRADLMLNGRRVRVVGMHLDLSGIRRRQQLRSVLAHVAGCGEPCPTVLMGDFNQWSANSGALGEFGHHWRVLALGHSFPSRRPMARLDRIVVSAEWRVVAGGVHRSALAARASDHLPIHARLSIAEGHG